VKPLRIAVAQSAITRDVRENGTGIREAMRCAAAEGARLVLFPEGALSGYAKAQIDRWDDVDWDLIRSELLQICQLARDLGIWAVVGSCHRLTPPHRPHNSLYVISDQGVIATRYDKTYCSHSELSDWYSPGSGPVVFEIAGFRFGCLLCIEIQFPELFAAYEHMGVDCLLLSSYGEDPFFDVLARAHAATNNFWVAFSVPAACSRAVSSRVIGPEGTVLASARPDGTTDVVTIDLNPSDPRFEIALTKARPWRRKARLGDIYRAKRVDDPRSADKSGV
jgi:predicted amidohydrolase